MASLGTCGESFTFPSPVHTHKVAREKLMKNMQRAPCGQSSEEQMSMVLPGFHPSVMHAWSLFIGE